MPSKRGARRNRVRSIQPPLVQHATPCRDRKRSVPGGAHPAHALEGSQVEQAALLEQNCVLAEEVHAIRDRLAASINDMRRQLDQTRCLAVECTLAEQQERRILAYQCREELQQLLVAIQYRAGLLADEQGAAGAPRWRELRSLIELAVRQCGRIVNAVGPHVFADDGLLPALHWLTAWLRDRYSFQVDLVTPIRVATVPEPVSLLLFHAIRHLVVNAAKHAHVSSATVELVEQDGVLRVTVSDHGVGFDPSTMTTRSGSSGLGLASIQQIADYLGGKLDIVSAPGQGCRVTLAVPIEPVPPTA